MSIVILAGLPPLCWGCRGRASTVPSNAPLDALAELRRVEAVDPTIDAGAAIRSGDLRFLAVAGYGVEVPGVAFFHQRFRDRYGYRLIEGTTDFPQDDEHDRLIDAAYEYAARYNGVLLRHVGQERSASTRQHGRR